MPFRRLAPDQASPSPDTFEPDEVERLFREHNDALLRFIAAKLGSHQEAKEIAQEAYVRILSLHRRETVSYLQAFLFKTASNLATDRLRQRARNKIDNPLEAPEAIFELSPERSLEGEQALKVLSAAIDELPEKCREAFLLYRLNELSTQEIASRMGLRERMVWRYIARALEYVRQRVYQEPQQDELKKKECAPWQ